MNITKQSIEELAPNAAAAKNGRDLVAKNKFSNLKITDDQLLIWGECAGSGKNPYYCSADYIDAANPVFRCNCPSRQFPCKHSLGLLYAYEQGLTFTTDVIPEDISGKRQKAVQRQEKKEQEKETIKQKAEKPKKVNANALIKKIDAQLSGLELAEKLLNNLVQMGLSAVDAATKKSLKEQIKQLGNYYIGGVQTAFNNLMLELEAVEADRYTPVIDQVNYIYALLKKGKEYLSQKKENPEAAPELSSAIEEQLGYVWKLTELMQYGLWEENAEVVQLSFYSYQNDARKEFVDEGNWLNLKTGKLYKTKTYRPYKAAKYIKEENSVFQVYQLKELFIYPGDLNPRIRWESALSREITPVDLNKIIEIASGDYASLVKTVKGSIKNPLMEKNPVALVRLSKTSLYGDNILIEDQQGNCLTLKDIPQLGEVTIETLKTILPARPEQMSLLVMINNDIEAGLFYAQPLSLITPEKIIRLLY